MIPSFPHVFSGNPGEFELDARLRHSAWPVWELDLFTQRHFNGAYGWSKAARGAIFPASSGNLRVPAPRELNCRKNLRSSDWWAYRWEVPPESSQLRRAATREYF